MNSFCKIKTFLSIDKKYLFCNCCLSFGKIIVGDYEQIMLASTLKMSLEDLLIKLKHYKLICIDEQNLEEIFDSISNDISNSCLPTFIESFDGDFGILCCINKKEFLIVKRWQDSDLIKIEISKNTYIGLISDALNEIPI
ncbi:hypothetical protein DU258_13030 [Salmonella enterica subsp. enterica]|uniref:Uncharacterized protein n=1 Tax=Salmonella enterica subsp. enterica serovar Macclesfield str. S-1643 TaxID=1242107 RepID=A0A2C9P3S3_SALET|nr:hypothetical protein [Salmonella enterica]EAA5488209.1 hypothetical protein [Salmonella enterica subsp. enterica serovar Kouka]ECH9430197.1 hypothetical protein [Salmonella enterica subsp. enterica]ASG17908.1 hypothetical protein LFZ25_19195 [Salmonella enterica subsp. enterica serovar Macclesfield str. S-1643]EAC1133411.1 hypothetical protein [Salmonella enterica subsp. enterica serovar Kambole]EBG0730709.1 hypothetical protein [Salmonella enterica subsp. enterica serovar Kambole]